MLCSYISQSVSEFIRFKDKNKLFLQRLTKSLTFKTRSSHTIDNQIDKNICYEILT